MSIDHPGHLGVHGFVQSIGAAYSFATDAKPLGYLAAVVVGAFATQVIIFGRGEIQDRIRAARHRKMVADDAAVWSALKSVASIPAQPTIPPVATDEFKP